LVCRLLPEGKRAVEGRTRSDLVEAILSWSMILVGVGLLLLVVADAVITTLAIVEMPGPLTRILSLTLWRGLRYLTSRSGSRLLRSAGPLVTLSVVSVWLVGAWLGWSLIFAAFPGAVIELDTGEPASFWSAVYFTANSIATTGAGDFVPSDDLWRTLGGAASIFGLGLITLAITYLLPVTSAAVFRFRFAKTISAMGGTPHEIVLRHWDGESLEELAEAVPGLVEGVVRLRAEHIAYPVLHFFHTGEPDRALALRVAALDEALTIGLVGLDEQHRLVERRALPLRSVIDDLLRTVVGQAFAVPREEVPPPPELEALRAAGIPVADQRDFEDAIREMDDRRRKLSSFVRDDAWDWPDVGRDPRQPSQSGQSP
jgi:hypothetical protein